jgi:hypothetical protein
MGVPRPTLAIFVPVIVFLFAQPCAVVGLECLRVQRLQRLANGQFYACISKLHAHININ